MSQERFVLVQALQTKGGELIPVWDESVTYSKSEMYGGEVGLVDEFRNAARLIECILDIKTKKLSTGIVLDYYPNKLDFQKGQTVMYEVSHRKLKMSKIVDIVFEEFETEITKGKKMDSWWVKQFKDVDIVGEKLYTIKKWTPFYVMEDGTKVKWVHQIYEIV